MVKIRVDSDTCSRCGICTALCVMVFELDEAGESAQITSRYRDKDKLSGEAPDSFDCVEIAARKCPVSAIKLSE